MAVVKINTIGVPEGAGPELEQRFINRLGAVDTAKGFLGFQMLRPVSGEDRYFIYTCWETDEDYRTWFTGAGMDAHSAERGKSVGTRSSVLEFEVVMESWPEKR
ncbi:MAG: antibiotic biosynthesis monooxygenase family protein [Sciscionella sp.]